ncbi:MAG: YajQ family cyclic di-GMP-binding protein [Gammaproteobacteria bacterium]|uniref:Nucleotide-binding protein H8D24_07765 n=1 Tax=Candidatus Thiopontia autotrophica TaxID=2841688 RepID=A0A8J6NYV1_9GAMM|nr:YajQ family cyclic di-GMP-binding protein [Candidatus Thiopontia autotrophica]
MPSFDTVSEVDLHEVTNAVDQANREISSRFDLKNTGASIEQNESELTLKADQEFQLHQVMDILRGKMAKRGVDADAMNPGDIETNISEARQGVAIVQGIDQTIAKKIVKTIKQSKIKVQAAIQGEKVRVTGKKRDDLQAVMSLLREEKFSVPLQFDNFRD